MQPKTYILRNDTDAEALGNAIAGATITAPIRVVVDVYRKRRSIAQNALLWKWNDAIRKWLFDSGVGFKNEDGETIRPYTSEEIHAWHKQIFLAATVVDIKGTAVKEYRSRGLTVMAFSEFLNSIDMYWAEQGLQLPHPDDLINEAHGNV
jgi:hypothetical protein